MMKYFLGCVTACAILAGVGYASGMNTVAPSTPAFNVRCSTRPTPIKTLGVDSYRSVRCATAGNETTPVYMGDQNVSPDQGYAICGHVSCMEQQITLNAAMAFCVVSLGTVDISCIALK